MADSYAQLKGYNPEADLGLGCGLPTEFARIETGDVVLDLAPAPATIVLLPGRKPARRAK